MDDIAFHVLTRGDERWHGLLRHQRDSFRLQSIQTMLPTGSWEARRKRIGCNTWNDPPPATLMRPNYLKIKPKLGATRLYVSEIREAYRDRNASDFRKFPPFLNSSNETTTNSNRNCQGSSRITPALSFHVQHYERQESSITAKFRFLSQNRKPQLNSTQSHLTYHYKLHKITSTSQHRSRIRLSKFSLSFRLSLPLPSLTHTN